MPRKQWPTDTRDNPRQWLEQSYLDQWVDKPGGEQKNHDELYALRRVVVYLGVEALTIGLDSAQMKAFVSRHFRVSVPNGITAHGVTEENVGNMLRPFINAHRDYLSPGRDRRRLLMDGHGHPQRWREPRPPRTRQGQLKLDPALMTADDWASIREYAAAQHAD